ncbi:MAG: chemotaxis protein CheW [Rickettsiales bacterium]|nr:chemotaxis protein CheW [Rickettsiales bacterium]
MDDLIGEFITETVESLSVLDGELVNLERNPDDSAILGNIFRIMHTIKGTCGFLGLPRLESVAHASENVLGKIRDKELTASPEAVSLVLESLDRIKGLIDYLSEHGSEQAGDDSNLIARLNHFADTGTVSSAQAVTVMSEAAKPHTPAIEIAPLEQEFPHFRGEDEPEIKAALEAMAQAAKVQATPVAMEELPAPKPAPAAVDMAPAEHKEGTAANANQSIRVSIDVLENLMQMVSELVLTRNQLMQVVRTKEDKDFLSPLQQLSHITTELQEGVMKTRMQPIGNAWSKFPRLIRDLSLELGKKIELKMVGAETELDRQLLEVIKDPLTHMVRNSCDHGLETPAERVAAGKPDFGTVTLSAYHEGGHIIIDIMDDGRGINIERVKQKAISNGLVTPQQCDDMSEKQLAQFIFAPGFSTAEKVTSVSGRGVGMDVVKTNIQKIGGTIDLDSSWGKGSKVSVKIPLTLAIVSVLLVEACGQKFALPQINIIELVRVGQGSQLMLETINDALVIRLRDKLLPITILSEALGMASTREGLQQKEKYIAVCKVGGYDFGILVDRVYNTEEIVVKPVADILKHIQLYSGNTILGDGSVIMILDPNGIARTIGDIDMAAARSEENAKALAHAEDDDAIDLLLFSTGNGAPKAVPLELVSRLEEIDVKSMEIADDYPVVQYRGDLMRLIALDNQFKIPNEGMMDVIVFSYDKKVVGLVVQEILDITKAKLDIKLAAKEAKAHNLLGSAVIEGKATDIIDVGALLSDFINQLVNDIGGIKKVVEHNSILLVEDSMFFRNLTVPFLAAAGYKVQAAENAQQALTILGKEQFDMIVTDIEMPGMNGFDFAATCRKNPKVNGIPIIAYTASISHEVVKRSKDVGMNDCIVKTDRVGLLESLLHHMVEYKGAVA